MILWALGDRLLAELPRGLPQKLRAVKSGSPAGPDFLSCLDLSVKKLQNKSAYTVHMTTKPSIRGLVFHSETV